jgi:hypothetical protein
VSIAKGYDRVECPDVDAIVPDTTRLSDYREVSSEARVA